MTYRGAFRFGSRLSGAMVAVVLSVGALAASCSLNPQPEPPGATDDSGASAGTTSAGGASPTNIAHGSGGSGGSMTDGSAAGGTGAGGDALTSAGGTGTAGFASAAGGKGGSGATQNPGAGAGGTSMSFGAGGSGGGDKANGGGAGESGGEAGHSNSTGGAGGISGGEGGSSAAGTGGGAGLGTGGSGEAGAAQAGAGGSGGGAIDPNCQGFATAYCERLSTCFPLVFDYPDVASCEADELAYCAGSPIPDPANSAIEAQCNTAITATPCSAGWGAFPYVCTTETGTKAVGDTCSAGGECETAFCNIAPGSTSLCGVCAHKLLLGDACNPTVQFCDAGLGCGTSGTCEALPAAIGATCVQGACLYPIQCNEATKLCEIPGGEGAACTQGEDCDRDHGFDCEPATQTCHLIPRAAVGEACGSASPDGAICFFSANCVNGLCVQRSALGGPCLVDSDCFESDVCLGANGTTPGTCGLMTFVCP